MRLQGAQYIQNTDEYSWGSDAGEGWDLLCSFGLWDEVLIFSVGACPDALKVLPGLLGQTVAHSVLLIKRGHQRSPWALVLLDESRVALDAAVPTIPLLILVAQDAVGDERIVAQLVEGAGASITADDLAIAAAGRAEIVIVHLYQHVSWVLIEVVIWDGPVRGSFETSRQGRRGVVSSDEMSRDDSPTPH